MILVDANVLLYAEDSLSEHHWSIFQRMLRVGSALGNLVSDAHLAALAMEHNGVLYSTDAGFARFRGLKWRNPIADR
jgi:predicted nucleic acid-binding protein